MCVFISAASCEIVWERVLIDRAYVVFVCVVVVVCSRELGADLPQAVLQVAVLEHRKRAGEARQVEDRQPRWLRIEK